MLKDHSQLQLSLSPYQGIYDAVIPANHLLRRIKENIDFSFVNPMLRKQYCENLGRPAKEPEMMFKLLFLKKLYDLSDEALISSAQTDMAYKFFLDLDLSLIHICSGSGDCRRNCSVWKCRKAGGCDSTGRSGAGSDRGCAADGGSKRHSCQ